MIARTFYPVHVTLDVADHTTDPAALPAGTLTPLDAVMAHPAERIVAALEGFDELDLPALLGVLGAGEVA